MWTFRKSFSITWIPGGQHPFGWEERSVIAPLLDEAAPRVVSRDAVAVAHRIRHGEKEWRWRNPLLFIPLLVFLILCLCLFPWSLPIELLMKRGWSETASGTVISVEKSNFTSRANNGPTKHYYTVGMRFQTPGGESVTAFRSVADDALIPDIGDTITLSYFPPYPGIVTYAGAGSGADFILLIISLAFFVVALALFVPFLLWRRVKQRIGKVLAFGESAVADIADITETRVKINGSTVVRCRLAVTRNGAKEETYIKTRGYTRDILTALKNEGKQVRILYLPGEQEEAVLVDAVEPKGA